jgi:hypothetical protein
MKSRVEVCSNKIVVVVLETNESEIDLCYAVVKRMMASVVSLLKTAYT